MAVALGVQVHLAALKAGALLEVLEVEALLAVLKAGVLLEVLKVEALLALLEAQVVPEALEKAQAFLVVQVLLEEPLQRLFLYSL